ncbi:5-hydroxytryptamine receptor 1 [Eufriesea mexicana]|uniref:5-hydroxytryptamine receptor 1 n=1 Tax=Eufriesea mexicana TaxID=516756 RepID=A0A310ST50_9HYME|nr:5-hydroxytryptamine receptor 1 [Eufriesea mexicana]
MEGKDAITTESTLLLNLTTVATQGFPGQSSPYTPTQAVLIALVLGGIILFTVIGNILVCVAVFLVKKLRRPCNYLLVSLAVSDLCVALLVMPMALLYEISGNWSFGKIMCDLWVSFDVLSCTASILNLCMISVDRFCAITKPLKYGVKRTPRRMIIYVSLVWLAAACISLPPLLIMGNEHTTETGATTCTVSQNSYYQIYATFGSFYIPLVVMIQVYVKIFLAARRIVLEEKRAQSHLEAHCYLDIEPTVQQHQPAAVNRQLNSDTQPGHGSPQSHWPLTSQLAVKTLDDESRSLICAYCYRESHNTSVTRCRPDPSFAGALPANITSQHRLTHAYRKHGHALRCPQANCDNCTVAILDRASPSQPTSCRGTNRPTLTELLLLARGYRFLRTLPLSIGLFLASSFGFIDDSQPLAKSL